MTENPAFNPDDVRTNLDDAAEAAEEHVIESESPYGSQPGGENVSLSEATDGVSATPESDASPDSGPSVSASHPQASHRVGDRFGLTSERVSALGDKVKDNLAAIDKMTPKEFGDLAMKVASDTAYAAAGLANLVTEKARELAEKQKEATDKARAAAFADTGEHAERPEDPAKAFLDQVTAQVNQFVEDLGHTYRDLAERGRDTVAKLQSQQSHRADAPKGDDAPGPFDIEDAADVAESPDGAEQVDSDPTKDWGGDNR